MERDTLPERELAVPDVQIVIGTDGSVVEHRDHAGAFLCDGKKGTGRVETLTIGVVERRSQDEVVLVHFHFQLGLTSFKQRRYSYPPLPPASIRSPIRGNRLTAAAGIARFDALAADWLACAKAHSQIAKLRSTTAYVLWTFLPNFTGTHNWNRWRRRRR